MFRYSYVCETAEIVAAKCGLTDVVGIKEIHR